MSRLFEGRFRSSLIEGDRYLLACQRYIELNPVRAGIVADPGAYPWSRKLFDDALTQDMLAEIRTATNGGFALGGERFQREIAAMLGRRTWRASPGRPRKSEGDRGQIKLPV